MPRREATGCSARNFVVVNVVADAVAVVLESHVSAPGSDKLGQHRDDAFEELFGNEYLLGGDEAEGLERVEHRGALQG